MHIKAAVLTAPHEKFEIQDVILDDNLLPNEVLVKVVATGLCHSDLAVRDRHMPFPFPAILGHEGAGIVEKIGSNVTKVKPGDHVVLATASCGECEYCITGNPNYCVEVVALNVTGCQEGHSTCYHDHNNNTIHGLFFYQSSFATYALASQSNVVLVPKDVNLAILGPLGCGIRTGAGSVLNELKAKPGQSIVVYGVGPVGLAAIMAAKASGCTTIIGVDIHDNRLEFAQTIGATHTINSKDTNVSDYILSNICSEGVHYFIETTGLNVVINDAVKSLRNLGKGVLLGVSNETYLELDRLSFSNGKSVKYVNAGGGVADIVINQLIDLYKKGLFPFDKMIRFYDFEDINKAVDDSEKGIVLKPILKMPDIIEF